MKPLKGIYKRNGKMVASLDDMEDGEVLSAVKHAGRPFDKSICMFFSPFLCKNFNFLNSGAEYILTLNVVILMYP